MGAEVPHLPGGPTGPSRLPPLWVRLAQPLLGLLWLLWDPTSHKNRGLVKLSRHAPFPHHRGLPQSLLLTKPDSHPHFFILGPWL